MSCKFNESAEFVNREIGIEMKRVLVILLMLVILPMTTFAQSVREEQGSVKIYFRVGATTIDENYKNNGKSLNKFAEIINACKGDKSAHIGVISIESSTSPEGTKLINDRIATLRAQAITDWLMAKTSVELVCRTGATRTNWSLLISEIERRNDVPYKQALLDVMHNTPEFEEVDGKVISKRLLVLQSLYSAEPYNWMFRNIFPDMRYAAASTTLKWELRKTLTFTSESTLNLPYVENSASVKFEKNVADGVVPTLSCDAEWISSIKATESGVDFVVAENPAHEPRTSTIVLEYSNSQYTITVNQEQAPKPEPAPAPVVEPTPEPTPEPAPAPVDEKKPFYMAIKTNMLYDVVGVPNLGVEFHLGKRFSLMANYTHAWWKNDAKNFYWRYYGAEASFRWWFGKNSRVKPLQGHHVGVNYQIMTYDFQLGGKGILAGKPGGILIDRPTHTVALEYGYSVPVARRLNLDFVIGAGYNWGIFDEYLPIDGHYVWQSTKRRQYFGPTKLEISLVWLIGHGNYNAKYNKKGKEAKR